MYQDMKLPTGSQDSRRAVDQVHRLIEMNAELVAALRIAQEHLAQYRRYSEEMGKIGRGLSLSSAYSEEYADSIIKAALL